MLFDGTEIPLSAQTGRYTAIVFWATWCPKSRKMIARYEELARHYSQRSDIDFFAVSVDKNEDFGKLKGRIQSQDLKTITHIFSGNDSQDDAFLSFKGNSVPYLVFIDRKGTVRLVDDDFDNFQEFLKGEFGY
jgi:thiol-disulfide isomerase/thioredoxin